MMKRREAISLGLTKYFTGKPCKNGHVAERTVIGRDCIECSPDRLKKFRQNHPGLQNKNARERWVVDAEFRERRHKAIVKWRQSNPDKVRLGNNAYIRDHRDKANLWQRQYFQRNPGKNAFWCRTRQARIIKAMPHWVNSEAIELFYKEAKALTEMTHIKFEVDHIIPLQGKNVCGLHVPWNLQVIPKSENSQKKNHLTFSAVKQQSVFI